MHRPIPFLLTILSACTVSALPHNPHNGALFTHSKRWNPRAYADDDLWQKSINKACILIGMMESDEKTAGGLFEPKRESAHSDFNFPEDFKKWGYVTKTTAGPDLAGYGLTEMLKSLSVSAGKANWQTLTTMHGEKYGRDPLDEQTYVVDGKTYRMTGAEFTTILNVNDGIIITVGEYGALVNGKLRNPPVTEDFPALFQYSDIVFGQWARVAGNRVSKLRYIIRFHIMNDQRQAIMGRALKAAGANGMAVWPGTEFDPNKEPGKALLGSVNGVGVGYLLGQRKKELGMKRVEKITVFKHHDAAQWGQGEPVNLFQIGDVPEEVPMED